MTCKNTIGLTILYNTWLPGIFRKSTKAGSTETSEVHVRQIQLIDKSPKHTFTCISGRFWDIAIYHEDQFIAQRSVKYMSPKYDTAPTNDLVGPTTGTRTKFSLSFCFVVPYCPIVKYLTYARIARLQSGNNSRQTEQLTYSSSQVYLGIFGQRKTATNERKSLQQKNNRHQRKTSNKLSMQPVSETTNSDRRIFGR